MAYNKDWINNLDEDSLKKAIKNIKILDDVPKKADKKIINLINVSIENIEFKPSLFEIFFYSKKIRLAFVAIILFIVLIPQVYFLIIKSYYNQIIKKANIYAILELNGDVVLTRNNTSITPKIHQTIIKNDSINTNENSDIKIKMGDKSEIKLYENSEIKTLELIKNKEDEKNKIYMTIGKIDCLVNLPSSESIFEISTKTSLISVKGTKFTLQVLENQDIILDVYEGIVQISNYTNKFKRVKKIRKIGKDIYEAFSLIKDDKILIRENYSVYIKNDEIQNYNKEIIQFINNTLNKINIKHSFSKQEKNKLLKTIDQLILTRKNIFKIKKIINENSLIKKDDDEKQKELFSIKKLPFKPNVTFSEISTAITNDKNKIYISSDSNKAIYCIDPNNGRVKWQFKNEKLKKITTPVFPFNNSLIISSPNNIFILDKNGKIKNIKEIIKGPGFWSSPYEVNKILYIPTFNNIYQFDGESINLIENFPNALGELYITSDSENLYCSDLNEQIIKVYNINKKKIIKFSIKFKNRIFISPIITDKYIFIADSKQNIYKIDKESLDINPKILNIGTGILTNIIIKNNYIYFIGINGVFYQLNIEKFNSAKKILKVDQNPEPDKYFTKKLKLFNNEIYFCSDTGKLFYYNINNNESSLIDINNNLPLIGTPVIIGETIYIINSNSNIYQLNKNY